VPKLDATALILGIISFAQAVFIAFIGYVQWRKNRQTGAEEALEGRRVSLAEVKADIDQNLMAVFQAQLTTAMSRIDQQDKVIADLRDQIHTLKIEVTDLEIQNRKLKAIVSEDVT